MSTRYRVYFTPFESEGTYGSEIEVSDRITLSGLNKMVKSIDASDFDIGIYYYGDLQLTGANDDGYFNEGDNRSIFNVGRNLTKARVAIDIDDTETTIFKGLINDESTRTNIKTSSIQFRVLSQDSIIRTSKVSAGLIADGTLISDALLQILNVSHITAVLGVSDANINPDLDVIIDDGDAYSNLITRDALNELLLISNSAMFIDASDNIIIKSREDDITAGFTSLYGPHDIHGRENIIDISGYNNGRHRVFTSVKVNTTERNNAVLQSVFGAKQKRIEITAITDSTKEIDIADRLLDGFSAPKIELKVKVTTELAKDLDLLDRVSVNYPFRYGLSGDFFPVLGVTELGATTETLPFIFGSISINPSVAFKIIEIAHSAKDFTTELKLRQRGTTLSDGIFNPPGNSLLGFGVLGEAILGG